MFVAQTDTGSVAATVGCHAMKLAFLHLIMSLVDAIVKHFTKSKSPTIQSLQHHTYYNDRRHLEREMYQLTETDKVYFLSVEFLLAWRKFLLGNEMPPEEINNQSLVVAREDYAYVGSPQGLPNGLELMNPYMAPFHDFGIISETSWKTLCKFYKGGPAMSEDNIPKDNPVYFPLLEEIAAGKQRIIEQCKTRKPNAKSVVPISTSATFSNYQQLPSSL
ncbi:hypothetical protein HDU99_009810 [Rhizoclosmatium hyalinum]|nr:hypothetical protein HDU99_009810 [Rhizoclosmatium hyalinum]